MYIWLNDFLRNIVGEDIYNNTTSFIDYKLHLSKYYVSERDERIIPDFVIYMADGRLKHGGLSDRLRGCVSLYYYCIQNDIDFKINFTSPFDLSNYLVPNDYDWEIDNNSISYDTRKSKGVIVKNNRNDNLKYLEKRLGNIVGTKQLHVYTNVAIQNIDYKRLFNKLFKPSERLQKEIDISKKEIGDKYVSVTFRFQQALGDFKENYNKVLSEVEQNLLIEKCLLFIEQVKKTNPGHKKVLVTADSIKFLGVAKSKFDFVYVIPGELFHIDYINGKNELAYMKSFVDLFMLSRSDYLYSYSTGPMYKNSGFAPFAAAIGGKPHKEVIE